MTVVDDHLVLELLLSRHVDVEGPITTTADWWWRLAVAVRRGAGGALSGPTLALAPPERAALVSAIDDLGDMLDIADIRQILPVAADIATGQGVNLLAAEALAVCLLDGATLAVGAHSPPLERAATALGVTYSVV